MWKKRHALVSDGGKIIANSTTDHRKDDRSQVSVLIKNINTQELLGDPGYDGENVCRTLHKKGMKQTIRPPNHLSSKKAKTEHQQNTAHRQTKGHHAWRNKNERGRREAVENTFLRFKGSFGSQFLSRDNDIIEMEIRSSV